MQFPDISGFAKQGIFNGINNFYDKTYYGKLKSGQKVQSKAIKKSPEQKFLEKIFYLAPGDKVLDVGCGPGIVLGMLEASGADLWGINISENAVPRSKSAVQFVPTVYGPSQLRSYSIIAA